MNPRNTALLLVAALGLFAFLYFYEIGGEDARLEAEERSKRLFDDVEAGDIDWIALRTSDGVEARFEQHEGKWRLVEPVAHPADAAVARIADTLASITRETEFPEPQPDAEYGLDDASARIVRFGVGDAEHTLRLGRETPVGSQLYAKTDLGPAVYTVAGHRGTVFARSLTDLREKQVLDFDAASVREIEARWPGGRVVVARAGAAEGEGPEAGGDETDWRMQVPVAARGDDEAIDELLATLRFLRAEGFIDAPSEADRSLLDPPDYEITLRGFDAEAPPRVLRVGRADADDRRPVQAGGGPLYRIAADRIDDFPRDPSAYRDRALTHFGESDVHQLDFFFASRRGDPTVIRAVRGADGWSSSPESFAEGKLPRIVSELARLEADTVLAEAMGEAELEGVGLSPPLTIVTALGAVPEAPEGEAGALPPEAPILAEVHFGEVTSAGVIARRAGEDTIYRVALATAENLPVSLEAFRNRFRVVEDAEAEPEGDPDAAVELLDPSEESP